MLRLRFLLASLLMANFFGLQANEAPNHHIVQTATLNDPRNITRLLIDENQKPTPALQELLLMTGIDCTTLTDCLRETQHRWIAVLQGMNGKERRDLIEPLEYAPIKKRVLEIIESLGLFDNQPPLSKHYDTAVCLGAFMEMARERLAYLVEAWKSGVRFDNLVFLGSDRPLRNSPGQIEDFARLCDPALSPMPFRADWIPPAESERAYRTEHDMHLLIWEQAGIPEDMRQHLEGHVLFVNTPPPEPGKRASTSDTYEYWKENYAPAPGSVLAASSPGIWCYQHLAGINALGPQFQLETFAPQLNNKHELQVIVILDTIAKCIYLISQ